MILDQVSYIHYPVQFRKNKRAIIQALTNSNSEVNAMAPAYAAKLGLKVCLINVGAQKINSSSLRTFEMVIAGFQIKDKLGKARFFQEWFLLGNISMKVVLGMFFLTFNNADIQFAEKEFTSRSYTTAEILSTTKWIKLIDKIEFAKVALDKEFETFVMHIAALEAPLSEMTIHSLWKTQILALIQDEAPTKIPPEYANYADIFSFDLAMELPKNTGINKYAIELHDDKQPPYEPIYSLGPVELEIFKTYIETHLKSGFIWRFKFPIGISILFDKKLDNSFWLCVDYWGLNNLTIKNQYSLPFIVEALDWLGRAKQFT